MSRAAGAAALLAAERALVRATHALTFGAPVAFVYRPLEYAQPIARAYVERFGGDGSRAKDAVLVGMNPGPFGMGQTGVPFGEVAAVRDWMKLAGKITPPGAMHPKRPVLGLDCTRSEVSGRRLWGAIAARHPVAEDFFARAYVVNYCPLLFLDAKGANVTPDKLAPKERASLEAACDEHLRAVLLALRPTFAIGIGGYAAKRLAKIEARNIVTIPHPSPASPRANRGWEADARAVLAAAGVHDLL